MKQCHTKEELDALIEEGNVVIDFYAEWCKPCKALAAIFPEIEEKFPNFTYVKVDIDEVEEAAAAFGIASIPHIDVYKGDSDKPVTINGNDREKIEKALSE